MSRAYRGAHKLNTFDTLPKMRKVRDSHTPTLLMGRKPRIRTTRAMHRGKYKLLHRFPIRHTVLVIF